MGVVVARPPQRMRHFHFSTCCMPVQAYSYRDQVDAHARHIMRPMLLHSPARTPDQLWEIRCFLRESGRNECAKWHQNLSTRARVKLRVRLAYLRAQPESRWQRPEASPLGNHVAVIRFTDENGTQHRLTGYFDHKHHAFVICVLGVEKDETYTPADYEQQTHSRRSEVGERFAERTAAWPWDIY
jgi:hypothetical protein